MSGMLCEMRPFSIPSHVSQTSASAVISFVSSMGSQQNPASGPVFFAVGTDFGKLSTFLRSVFSRPNGGAPRTGVTDEEIVAEPVMGVDDSEEGPGTGREEGAGMGWECDAESVDADKRRELVMAKSYRRQDPTASC